MENVKSVDSYLNGAFQRRFEFRKILIDVSRTSFVMSRADPRMFYGRPSLNFNSDKTELSFDNNTESIVIELYMYQSNQQA